MCQEKTFFPLPLPLCRCTLKTKVKEARTIFVLLGLLLLGLFIGVKLQPQSRLAPTTPTPIPSPTAIPTITPTPTPRPLTFAEMNERWGPCSYVPTLMYHHVQPLDEAKTKNQTSLTVAPDTFRSQMEYLKNRGYTTVKPSDLIAFFDSATPLPPKPILLTFDDGYEDVGSVAAPIIREFGFSATAFIPTGLLENPGYMTWGKISELAGSEFYIANHTWSHRNVATSRDVDEREIGTADKQLAERGFNQSKVFAYPYGFASANGLEVLRNMNYTLAFTTIPGSTLCKGQRLTLPRIRIGNSSLSAYGL
ncbi:MAG: polysaccharide deacetylase family protein [Patescibacteria group bacterium]